MRDRSEPDATVKVERHLVSVDVSHAVEEAGEHAISAQVTLPVSGTDTAPHVVLCCLPGGFLSKAYFDLEIDGNYEFSFVEYMARRGFATICLDHLGSGESSRPKDGYAFGVDALALANRTGTASSDEHRKSWALISGWFGNAP